MTEPASRPAVHAVCGGVGAGKSTFARHLKKQHDALLFSGDKWMARLFLPDLTGEPQLDWMLERIERMEDQVWQEALQAAEIGISSILDLGLTTPGHRMKFATLGKEAKLPVILHWLDLPPELRWQRTELRNQQKGETFAMSVSRENFELVEDMWVAPGEAELQVMDVRRYDAAALDELMR